MRYKFFREETQKWEEIEAEKWRWEAHYNDGTVLKQFEDGKALFDDMYLYHQFKEIDQTKLVLFKMVSPDCDYKFVLPFDPKSMKLIHFYRHFGSLTLTEGENPAVVKQKAYCFGYEVKSFNRTRKICVFITPENEFVITENPENINFEVTN